MFDFLVDRLKRAYQLSCQIDALRLNLKSETDLLKQQDILGKIDELKSRRLADLAYHFAGDACWSEHGK